MDGNGQGAGTETGGKKKNPEKIRRVQRSKLIDQKLT